jgi:molybdate transport system substrate-binding protein
MKRYLQALLAIVLALAPASGRAESVKVFAAASLKTALDDVLARWKQETGHDAVASYAATPALAKQIAEGAPADIFISADEDWMNDLIGKKLIDKSSRRDLLGNSLVLVAPIGSGKAISLSQDTDLAGLLAGGRLALAEVKSVPAGRYAKAALENLGLWPQVENSLAMSENVRAALVLVSRGEAALGIVYGSDAKAERGVETVAVFPATSHPPIVYPAARVQASANPDAKDLLNFLSSDAAKQVFDANGFTVLK